MSSAENGSETIGDIENPFISQFVGGRLKTTVEAISAETGDPALAKQALVDFFALDRQQLRDHFEGRLEFARHVMAHQETTNKALVEYGLQTLKWSFLLNAGAVAIVIAYVGGAIKSGSIVTYAPMIKALWPLVAGCVCVLLASAAAYFNFAYYEGLLPTPHALNNFLPVTAKTWPIPRAQKIDESTKDFQRRFLWKVNWSRRIAIGLGLLSALFFCTWRRFDYGRCHDLSLRYQAGKSGVDRLSAFIIPLLKPV
jgi:hypothetical protein